MATIGELNRKSLRKAARKMAAGLALIALGLACTLAPFTLPFVAAGPERDVARFAAALMVSLLLLPFALYVCFRHGFDLWSRGRSRWRLVRSCATSPRRTAKGGR